jgi:hypothetical protein
MLRLIQRSTADRQAQLGSAGWRSVQLGMRRWARGVGWQAQQTASDWLGRRLI